VLERVPQTRLQLAALRLGLTRLLMRSDASRLLFGTALQGERPSPAEIRVALDLYLRLPDRDVVTLVEGMGTADLYERLGELTIPTVVVCGRRDRLMPVWHSERLAARIPGAHAEWLDGVGHMVTWEAPEAVVAAVARCSTQPAIEEPMALAAVA
jgi:pimeloyl-ACP methyl ester carboxylesterase